MKSGAALLYCGMLAPLAALFLLVAPDALAAAPRSANVCILVRNNPGSKYGAAWSTMASCDNQDRVVRSRGQETIYSVSCGVRNAFNWGSDLCADACGSLTKGIRKHEKTVLFGPALMAAKWAFAVSDLSCDQLNRKLQEGEPTPFTSVVDDELIKKAADGK